MPNQKFLLCLVLLPVATAIRQQMQGVSKALEEVSSEDGTTAKEQQSTSGVRDAVRTCTKALMQPCTGIPNVADGYAQAYINSRDSSEENTAERICQETNDQLWQNMNVADVPGLDPDTVLELGEERKHAVEYIGQMRAAAGGNHAMEALMREHLLKCICVHRSDYVDVCYQGGQGITEGEDLTFGEDGTYTGKLWCQFGFGMPSWREGGIDTTVLEKHKQYNGGALPEPLSSKLCADVEGRTPHFVETVKEEERTVKTEWAADEVEDPNAKFWTFTKSGGHSVKRCNKAVAIYKLKC